MFGNTGHILLYAHETVGVIMRKMCHLLTSDTFYVLYFTSSVSLACTVSDHVICLLQRLKELHTKEPSAKGNMLRLSVEAGGCSGFQYTFSLDNKENADDRLVAMLQIEVSRSLFATPFLVGHGISEMFFWK